MPTQRARIYVDLDQTLNQYRDSEWKGVEFFPELRPGAVEFLDQLRADGFDLVLYTARASIPEHKEEVQRWLKTSPLDGYFLFVTAKKGYDAYLFVDDRAIQFKGDYTEVLKAIRNWKSVRPMIDGELSVDLEPLTMRGGVQVAENEHVPATLIRHSDGTISIYDENS